jgi:hypothetical protein
MDSYLAKPIRAAELARLIEEIAAGGRLDPAKAGTPG